MNEFHTCPDFKICHVGLKPSEATRLQSLLRQSQPITQGKPFFFIQPDHTLLVSAWPDLHAWVMNNQAGKWKPCLPSLAMYPQGPVPVYCVTKTDANHVERVGHLNMPRSLIKRRVLEWAKTLPPECVAISRYLCNRWSLLMAAAKVLNWLEIAHENPLRAFLIAGEGRANSKPDQILAMRARAKMSFPKLLIASGFPSDRESVKILLRVDASLCTEYQIRRLRNLFKTKHVMLICEAPVLTSEPLKIAATPALRRLCTPGFLRELWNSNDFLDDFFLLHQAADLFPGGVVRKTPFHSLQELRETANGSDQG